MLSLGDSVLCIKNRTMPLTGTEQCVMCINKLCLFLLARIVYIFYVNNSCTYPYKYDRKHEYRLCLLTFRPIALTQVQSLTITRTLRWLGGLEVTHLTGVPEVPSFISGFGKDFNVVVFCCCLFCLYLLLNTHYLARIFSIPFAMLIHLLYFTYYISFGQV